MNIVAVSGIVGTGKAASRASTMTFGDRDREFHFTRRRAYAAARRGESRDRLHLPEQDRERQVQPQRLSQRTDRRNPKEPP